MQNLCGAYWWAWDARFHPMWRECPSSLTAGSFAAMVWMSGHSNPAWCTETGQTHRMAIKYWYDWMNCGVTTYHCTILLYYYCYISLLVCIVTHWLQQVDCCCCWQGEPTPSTVGTWKLLESSYRWQRFCTSQCGRDQASFRRPISLKHTPLWLDAQCTLVIGYIWMMLEW